MGELRKHRLRAPKTGGASLGLRQTGQKTFVSYRAGKGVRGGCERGEHQS